MFFFNVPWICRVVQHSCADAELTVFSFQDVMVDTSFASFPERFVVCQFVEGDRDVSQFGVHFHNSCSGGQAENLSFRPTEACQLEGSLFDAFCQPQTTEIGMYDQTGGLNKKEIKENLSDLKKANITVRNFPATVAELRKRIKLAEGGDTYLFASTLNDGQKILIRCGKV